MAIRRKVLVLGSGMIGSAMAMDLSPRGEWNVTVADVSREQLVALAAPCRVRTEPADPFRFAELPVLRARPHAGLTFPWIIYFFCWSNASIHNRARRCASLI